MLKQICLWLLTAGVPSWGCGKCGATYDTHDQAFACFLSH